jgi:hypothetical protein
MVDSPEPDNYFPEDEDTAYDEARDEKNVEKTYYEQSLIEQILRDTNVSEGFKQALRGI